MQMFIELRPMSEAPRDGTEVLLMDRCGTPVLAYWDDYAFFGQYENGPGWQVWYCDDDPWYSYARDDGDFTGFFDIHSHICESFETQVVI